MAGDDRVAESHHVHWSARGVVTEGVRELTERFARRVGVQPSSAISHNGRSLQEPDTTLASTGVETFALGGGEDAGGASRAVIALRIERDPLGLMLKDGPRHLFVGRKVLNVEVRDRHLPEKEDGSGDDFDIDDSISDAPGPSENGPDMAHGGGFRLLRNGVVHYPLDHLILKDLVGLTPQAIDWCEFRNGRPVPAGTSGGGTPCRTPNKAFYMGPRS